MKILFLAALFFCIILSASSKGYATYHMYTRDFSLLQCACSDGKNGLITRWNINTISTLYPYVTAFNLAGWNSPQCGACLQLTNRSTGKFIYVTAIDQCGGPPAGYDAHFDLSPDAFAELYGSTVAGVGDVDWTYANYRFCKGNRG